MPATARNNVLAGLFVVGGLALGVWVSFMLGESTGMSGLPFTVRFSIEDGAVGLKPGSAVLLGGKQVGRVTTVDFAPGAAPGDPPLGVDVNVEIRGDLTIYENASITLERPLLGTLSSIGIRSVGSESSLTVPPIAPARPLYTSKPTIEPGEVVVGSAMPALLAQAGLSKEQIASIGPTLNAIKDSTEKFREMLRTVGPDVSAAVKEANTFIANLNVQFMAWEKDVATTLAEIAKASKRADPLMADAQALIAKADKGIETFLAVVEENRAPIRESIASIQSITRKADTQLVEPLLQALLEADRSLEAFTRGVNDVRTLLGESGFDIKHTIANFRLASEQLKLATVEIRSSPWRLMYKPSLKERETEDIYGAAAAFANAASNVRGAAEALAAASKSATATSPLTPERLAVLLADLESAGRTYRDSGTALMDELVDLRKRE